MPPSRRIGPTKLGLSLVSIVVGTVLTALVAMLAIRSVLAAADRVTSTYADDLMVVATVRNAAEREASSGRAYLIAKDDTSLRHMQEARSELRSSIAGLTAGAGNAEDRKLVDEVAAASDEYAYALDRVIASRRSGRNDDVVRGAFDDDARPAKDALSRTIQRLADHKQQQLVDAERAAARTRATAVVVVIVVGASAIVVAAVLALQLARAWRRASAQQEELAALLEQLERSNRDLESFAGRVAHDVRGALGPMAMASDLLAKPNVPEATVERTAATLARSVQRARALVDALLAFSRARVADPHAHAPIRAAVDAVVEDLGVVIAEADVTVKSDVEDVEVACPSALLYVVVTNIVGNAVKLMRGRAQRRLAVTSRCTDGGCELRFEDTGPGIPEEARARIFEPFFRVPGTVVPGTGIGLATVARIVDAHGGRIAMESELGVGTAFRVWLPLASFAEESVQMTSRASPSPVT
jgi:signal transduction histidine kinase